jgi:hypothetical protein
MPNTAQPEFRGIPGFVGYRAGSDGTIWTCKYRAGRQWKLGTEWKRMKANANKHGYMHLTLSRPGLRKNMQVHQLVMLAFNGPPPDGMNVCHENNTPGDDRLDNLRYDTRCGNLADRKKFGTEMKGDKNGRSILSAVDVRAIRSHPVFRGSRNVLALRFGVSPETIGAINKRRIWKHVA